MFTYEAYFSNDTSYILTIAFLIHRTLAKDQHIVHQNYWTICTFVSNSEKFQLMSTCCI